MNTFITQPFTPQSYNQILQTLISYMSAQSDITDANIGAVCRTFFESISLVIDNSYFQLVNVLNAYYINTATGTDLDRRGTDFNLPRFLNSSAVTNVFFTGTVGTTVPAGTIVFVPASGNTQEIDFITQNSGLVGQPISVVCLTTGSIGNVDATSIANIQNNPNSLLITGVSNPLKAVGGFDQETDAAYRIRIIDYLTSLSQGTVNAITSALLDIPNAGITEVKILQINLSPSNPGGPSTGYALSFTPPYTNSNTDLQGTILNPVTAVGRLASTTALSTNIYNNGAAGVGATLTATAFGLLSLDGIAVLAGDRVLIKNEAIQSHNGTYVVTQAGSISTPYILIRATDLNTPTQFPNYSIDITAGNTLAGQSFIQTNQSFTLVGTSSANFSVINQVNFATIAPLFPTNTYNNGTLGVGATLTATANGVLTVDGSNPTLNQRILVKNELLPAHNGVYVLTTVGTPSVPYVLTRATDLNTASQFPNYSTDVLGGVTLSATTFIQTNLAFTTVGTDSAVFTEVTGILASGPVPNSPGSIVVVIDNGEGSLPFSSVEVALNVVNGVPTNSANYPGEVAAGIQAFVTRPSLFIQPITLTIVTDPNSVLNPVQIAQNVQTAIENYFTQLPLGGTIYRSEVIDVPETAFIEPPPFSDVFVGVADRAVPGLIIINY
jgi:Baseplate J-like protein